jgi:hypothetical protein
MVKTKKSGGTGPAHFKGEWATKYCLQVFTQDPVTTEVTSVLCLMCHTFGRDDDDDENRKRKRTTNDKIYTPPWRTDNFTRHLAMQHFLRWQEYERLSAADKVSYFTQNEIADNPNMHLYVQPQASVQATILSKQKFTCSINKEIVDDIVWGLYFDPDIEIPDENVGAGRNKRVFEYNEEDKVYSVSVKSILKMNMIVKFVAVGVSFNQANRLYQSVKDEAGMGILGSTSDMDVAQHCRIVCAINLQYMKELFTNVWAFSIGLHAGNNAGTTYLDIRIQCCVKNELQHFHLLAIPMQGRYQNDVVVAVLDILVPNWRHQLVGITVDTASTMTDYILDIFNQLDRECHSSLYQIWYGAHQLDLMMKNACSKLCNNTFLNTLNALSGHLRQQQDLIEEMRSTCPTFVSTKWISMVKVFKWLKENQVILLAHFDNKKPRCTPSQEWWIIFSIIQPLVERVDRSFVMLQGMDSLVNDQRQILSRLTFDLKNRMNVETNMTNEDIMFFNNFLTRNPSHGFLLDNCSVTRDKILEAIDEVGHFVQVEMDKLKESRHKVDMNLYNSIISTVATFSLQLITGIDAVVVAQENRIADSNEVPPVLPLDLCMMNARVFTAALQHQDRRLKFTFSEQDVIDIDQQFRDLRIAFREEDGLGQALESARDRLSAQTFQNCWSPLGDRFDKLQQFCGGIASVMPVAGGIEKDFSVIHWKRHPNSRSMTDFALEAILHCKQHARLQKLYDN